MGGWLDSEAFVWDDSNGMRLLQNVLEEGGVDLSEWTLVRADGISNDGRTIVGVGYHNGYEEAFVAVIPEPSSASLIVIGSIAGLLCRSHCRTYHFRSRRGGKG